MTVIKNFNRILHGGDYNPDQWLHIPGIIDRDFELMEESCCNTFSVAIFSWGQIEVEEGKFAFSWLDDIFARCAESGKKLFLATPSAAKPAWLGKKYPESCKVHPDGQRYFWGNRQNNCLTSPIFREKVRQINRKLAERYANHPALAGWHISNEYNGEPCCCDLCIRKFHEFLKEKYGTLENLNKQYWSAFWGHHLTDWDQIHPLDGSMNTARLDWRRFITANTVEFFRMEIDAVREFSDAPVTTNLMGYYDPLDYWKFVPYCDFIADDCYPSWYHGETEETAACFAMLHDLHYTMLKKPFVMMESCPGIPNYRPYVKLRRPNEFQREMLLALGHGADGTMYFQWRKGLGNCEKIHGAVVGHDGGDQTLAFQRVADYGRKLESISEIVDSAKAPEAAVIYDWESNWALDLTNGFGGTETKKWQETARLHYRALWEKNIDLAVIDSEQEFDSYKLIVAPMLFMLKKGVAERLKRFVENGGTLVMTYLSAYVDENNACFFGGNPGGSDLRKFFGIWNEDIDGLEPSSDQTLLWNGKTYRVSEYAEYLHAEGAEVAGVYGGEFYQGSPALTIMRQGKGKAIYLGARTRLDFLSDFYGKLLDETGIRPVLEGMPAGVKASRRTAANGDAYYFLLNMTEEPQTVALPRELREIWGTDTLRKSVEIPSRSGTILKG